MAASLIWSLDVFLTKFCIAETNFFRSHMLQFFQEIRFIIVHGTDIEKLVKKIKSHGGSPFCNSGLLHQSIGMRITHKYSIKNRYIARNMEIRLKYK